MLKAGVFLQNRYEIISRIGSGGMADVYRAKDHKLNRFVAVKVLKQEFKDESGFISKFRVEAQAAAGLAHANIVNVYDVGEENGVNFIVMELVEGITLKAYITKKGKIPVREATSIALQVAAGLEAAHNNGIIHRDVKPQNIIISMDGKAKVTDFGIARAASSNTINSSVMGSVHYSSPEQTRGGYSDAKSDIYSMGITMYEMLTGRVPFDGDSTVAVALKHLQEDMIPPRKLAPEIPYSTEQIILKCTQKSPDRRYGNMTELIQDLKESLVNPEGNFVTIASLNNNAHTVLLSREEINQIKNGTMPTYDETLNTGAAGSFAEEGNVGGDNRSYPYGGNYYQKSGYQDLKYNQEYGGSYTDSPYASNYSSAYGSSSYQDKMNYPPEEDLMETDDDFSYDEEEYQRRRKKPGYLKKKNQESGLSTGAENLITVACIAAAVVVGCILLAMLASALGLFHFGSKNKTEAGEGQTGQNMSGTVTESAPVEVPSLLGKTEAQAQSLLNEYNLGYKYQGESPSSEYPKGQVVSQSVEAGSLVDKNTTVGYVLSSGSSENLKVPGLTNASLEDAKKALTGMGLVVTVDNSRYSDTVAEGNVITTNPGSGSAVNVGDTVTVYVSQGQEASTVEVPKVVGHYVDDASKVLTNIGLYVFITEVTDSTVEKGMVISQDIEAGSSVQTGTSVTLTVSAGSPDPEIVVNPEGTWKCNVQLKTPQGYENTANPGEQVWIEAVRIELVQNGTATTIYEGGAYFPYSFSVEGQAGVTTGTANVYILNPQTWAVEDTITYEGIEFGQVE